MSLLVGNRRALLTRRDAAVAPAGPLPDTLFAGSETGGFWDVSLSTLWQDSARTTPATANNDPVGAVDDLSGNVNHLLQATAGQRPLLKISGAIKWLEGDGVDDYLRATFTHVTPFDRVTAYRTLVWVGSGDSLLDGVTLNSGRIYQEASTPSMFSYGGGASGTTIANLVVGADEVLTDRWSGTLCRTAIDNNGYASGADTGAPGGITVMANGDLSGQLAARWYGTVSIGRTMTDPEIALCRTYFAALQGRVL